MTQEEVNELYYGVEYRLAYRYASMIKTLFLTMLYAPLAPLVVPVGFVGLWLQYWADKVCLLRTARRPPAGGVSKDRLELPAPREPRAPQAPVSRPLQLLLRACEGPLPRLPLAGGWLAEKCFD